MKKFRIFIKITLLALLIIPTQSKAETESKKSAIASTNASDAEMASVLLERLGKINDMDKSELSFSEKRILKKEVRSIQSQLKKLDGGVYLSVGAIIIILLLIILL